MPRDWAPATEGIDGLEVVALGRRARPCVGLAALALASGVARDPRPLAAGQDSPQQSRGHQAADHPHRREHVVDRDRARKHDPLGRDSVVQRDRIEVDAAAGIGADVHPSDVAGVLTERRSPADQRHAEQRAEDRAEAANREQQEHHAPGLDDPAQLDAQQ